MWGWGQIQYSSESVLILKNVPAREDVKHHLPGFTPSSYKESRVINSLPAPSWHRPTSAVQLRILGTGL